MSVNDAFPSFPTRFIPGTNLFPATNPVFLSCQPGGGCGCCGCGNSPNLAISENVASNTFVYPLAPVQTQAIHKHRLYRQIKQDNTEADSSVILQNFYASNSLSNFNMLDEVENDLSAGNFISAQGNNSSINPNNIIERNYKRYFKLYLKYQAETFDNSDNLKLEKMAKKCPFTNGVVIYQARALHNLINLDGRVFKDDCKFLENGNDEDDNEDGEDDNLGRSANSNGEKGNIHIEKLWQVDLFPNPATDEINIVSGNQTEDISVLIVDVTGKQLLKTQVSTKAFTANLKLNLLNGIYFVTLKNADNETAIKKLVIAK